MTQTMTNADVVRRGYQAFNEADIDTINRLWRDDVTWTTPGESTVAGTAKGKGAVLTQYGRYGGETNEELVLVHAASKVESRDQLG